MRFDWWEFIISMMCLNAMFWLGFYRGQKYEEARKTGEVEI